MVSGSSRWSKSWLTCIASSSAERRRSCSIQTLKPSTSYLGAGLTESDRLRQGDLLLGGRRRPDRSHNDQRNRSPLHRAEQFVSVDIRDQRDADGIDRHY